MIDFISKLRVLAAVGLLGLAVHGALGDTKYIRLRNQVIVTAPPHAPLAQQTVAAETPVSGLYLVQFNSQFKPAWRDSMQTAGVGLLHYVPDDAFLVRLSQARLSQLQALPFVRWVGEYRPEYKVHRTLRVNMAGPALTNTAAIRILLSPDVAETEVVRTQRSMPASHLRGHFRFGTILEGQASAAQLQTLAVSPSVLWIEPFPQYKLYDEVSSKIVGGPNPSDGHATATQAEGYDGRGTVVAVADTGLNNGNAATMHPDLFGRVDAFLFYGNLLNAADEESHGTHVTGIIAGNGAMGETDENGALYGLGVAPGAHIIVQRIFDASGNSVPFDDATLTRDAVQAGAVIGSNSWGNDTQGGYDLDAAAFDALVRDADSGTPGDQPYILEFSAGNAGPGYQTVGSPAVAKNVIASGASENDRTDLFIYTDGPDVMADFSSRGPCEDGRIKPDVVAPGTWIASLQSASAPDTTAWLPISANYQYEGGTSQSGPHVSGAAAVFVQYYRQTHAQATPSPALVKAALINSAVELDLLAGNNPVPNQDEGWGRVDLTRLINSTRRYDYLDQTVLLTTGQAYERRILVAGSSEPLKITLAYTDVPALPAAIPALVNDLDLEVVAPDGTLYRGNQFDNGESIPNAAAPDNVNNVEAVHLFQPLPGEYVIRVRARNVAEDARVDTVAIDQDFALVTSGDLPLPGVGVISFDRNAYTVPSQIHVTLVDYDLAGQPATNVLVHSTTQTNALVLALNASGSNGIFTGSVATATGPAVSDGRLHIKQGDTIEGIYQDASPAGVRTVTAIADLQPPVLSNVTATNQFGKVIITWQTDEPATGVLYYGTNLNALTAITSFVLDTTHEFEVNALIPGTTNWFWMASTDAAGNSATNNNQGQYFQIVAAAAASVLLVDDYEPDQFTDAIPVTSYTDALDQTKISYNVWNVLDQGRFPGTNDLQAFRAVIWRISDSVYSSTTVAPQQQADLQTYLNQGGGLFLASMELLSRLGSVPFTTNVLQVQSFNEDVGVPSIVGEQNDPISSGVNVELDYSAYPTIDLLGLGPDFSDTFAATSNAAPIILDANSGQTAGIRYPRTGLDTPGRVVFFSFPFDAIPLTGDPPNNRANILRNILSFLAPGINGLGTISFDNSAYTIPSRALIEVADSDLANQGQITIQAYSDLETNGEPVVLRETVRPGVYRGYLDLESITNAPAGGQLRVRDGDHVWAEYFDASNNGLVRATATVDTQKPVISNIAAAPDYTQATITWESSEPTDALVQFGPSTFLGRTAYLGELATSHSLVIDGLLPDHLYYYQVVGRDAAGNTAVDDNGGRLYTVKTLAPLTPPWSDNLDTAASTTNWTVLNGMDGSCTWQLGVPNNGLETAAHSPPNAWGCNLNGGAIDLGDTSLISPAIFLTGGNLATLRFWHSYDFTPLSDMDIYEYGQVNITTNSGVVWTPIGTEYSDASGGWVPAEIDLTPYLGQVVHLGWYYGLFSLDTAARPGWLVDDISITVTNLPHGTVIITNNLSQAHFTVTGPVNQTGEGWFLAISNAPLGQYTVTFKPVTFYDTPAAQTGTLSSTNTLVLSANYTFPDLNQNGLPDAWEQQYFGMVVPNHPGGLDTDGDGSSDYQEFIAGTDPTNALSNLHFALPIVQTNNTVQLEWYSVAGRSYRLQSCNQAWEWTPASDWIRATGARTSFTLPAATAKTSTLFRLEVRP